MKERGVMLPNAMVNRDNYLQCQNLKCLIFLAKLEILLHKIYLGFYVAFNTVQVISRRVVGRAEETST